MEFFQNHFILVLGWIACVIGIGVTYIQDKMLGVQVIGNNLVAIITSKEKGIILDLRSLNEFRQGHITGSIHVLPTDISKDNLGKISMHKETPLILTNLHGNNLQDSAKELKKLGYQKIYILKEGIDGWLSDNLPLVKK